MDCLRGQVALGGLGTVQLPPRPAAQAGVERVPSTALTFTLLAMPLQAGLSITRAKVRTFATSNSSGHTFYVMDAAGGPPDRCAGAQGVGRGGWKGRRRRSEGRQPVVAGGSSGPCPAVGNPPACSWAPACGGGSSAGSKPPSSRRTRCTLCAASGGTLDPAHTPPTCPAPALLRAGSRWRRRAARLAASWWRRARCPRAWLRWAATASPFHSCSGSGTAAGAARRTPPPAAPPEAAGACWPAGRR